MACEGITKDGAYLIGTINGGHLNRSNSNGILNQTRINKSNVSILKRCDRRRALHPAIVEIKECRIYIGVGGGKERLKKGEGEGVAGGHRGITSPGLLPMAKRLISNFKSNKNDS